MVIFFFSDNEVEFPAIAQYTEHPLNQQMKKCKKNQNVLLQAAAETWES